MVTPVYTFNMAIQLSNDNVKMISIKYQNIYGYDTEIEEKLGEPAEADKINRERTEW